jgi:site-specific recombinase XerD
VEIELEIMEEKNHKESQLVEVELEIKERGSLSDGEDSEDENDIMNGLVEWIKSTRNKNTSDSYKSQYDQYKKFCQENNLKEELTSTVCLHIKAMTEEKKSFTTIKSRIAAINDTRAFRNLPSLFEEPLMKKTLMAAKEVSIKTAKKAKTLTTEQMTTMAEITWNKLKKAIADGVSSKEKEDAKKIKEIKIMVRDMTMMVFMFGGLLRASEAVNLKVENVVRTNIEKTNEQEITLSVTKSKNNKTGKTVRLTRGTIEVLEPTRWFETMKLVWKERPNHRPFFENTNNNNKMSTSSVTHILRRHLELIGNTKEEAKKYSSHSFRRGGTSEAIKKKVSKEVVMKQGNWRSNAIMEYIEPDEDLQRQTSNAIFS